MAGRLIGYTGIESTEFQSFSEILRRNDLPSGLLVEHRRGGFFGADRENRKRDRLRQGAQAGLSKYPRYIPNRMEMT
jgi:hypothetical protein